VSKPKKRLSGKALGGIITGVVAFVGLVTAALLWFCRACECVGRKKKTEENAGVGAEKVPQVYDEQNKGVESQVQEAAPEVK
jgi:hypothetical protein